jgi:hypothetical protein
MTGGAGLLVSEGESTRARSRPRCWAAGAVLGQARVRAGVSARACERAARLGRTGGREGNRPEFVLFFFFEKCK